MAAEARRLAINPHGDEYSDGDDAKQIELQATGLIHGGSGDRHVLLQWTNDIDASGTRYTQLIQLTGGPGNYSFHTPAIHSEQSRTLNTFYPLREYTQRDQIIALAKAVQFNKRSRVNNCHVWMRDLLESMANANLISRALFEQIDTSVPFKKRLPESMEITT